MDEEIRKCVEQHFPGHRKDANDDGDTVKCSIDTSRWSTPSSSLPQCEHMDDLLVDMTSHQAIKHEGLKKPRRSKDRGVQGPNKQKLAKAARPRVQSAPSIHVLELMSQVKDLQQQVREGRAEKKQLTRLLHRHMVELQYYQESEDSVSQILRKHKNEARTLKELLRDTRGSRDSLARRLRTTEDKLQLIQSNLRHLQQLSQDHSLLDRERLTRRLAQASAELQEKDKTIADMKKNLALCQASFNRQVLTEEKKSKEATRTAYHLQEGINHLIKRIQDRERELQNYNIYCQRFNTASRKKDTGNKTVQTDELPPLPVTADILQETQCESSEEEEQSSSHSSCCNSPVPEPEVVKNQEKEVSENILQHQSDPTISSEDKNTETYTDARKESSSEEAAENQSDSDCDQPKKLLEDQECLEEKEDNGNMREGANVLKQSPDATQLKSKQCTVPRVRHSYIFPQSVEDLHHGRPVCKRREPPATWKYQEICKSGGPQE